MADAAASVSSGGRPSLSGADLADSTVRRADLGEKGLGIPGPYPLRTDRGAQLSSRVPPWSCVESEGRHRRRGVDTNGILAVRTIPAPLRLVSNVSAMRSACLAFLLTVAITSCGRPDVPATPRSLGSQSPDSGFPTSSLPVCGDEVRLALVDDDGAVVSRLAVRKVTLRCHAREAGETVESAMHSPLPLDVAVRNGRTDQVRQLLAAGADSGERWGWMGDHHPLQEAIDARLVQWGMFSGVPHTQGAEIISLLRRAGADTTLRDWQGRTAADYAAPQARERVGRALTDR